MGHITFWFLLIILFYWANAFVVNRKENAEFLLDASKKVSIEINAEKTEYTNSCLLNSVKNKITT
jgi:hypothetical protein